MWLPADPRGEEGSLDAISDRDRIEREPQRRRALVYANRVRMHRAQLKRRIHTGVATVAEALREHHDECLRNASIMEIVIAQRRWGRTRALSYWGARGWARAGRLVGSPTAR